MVEAPDHYFQSYLEAASADLDLHYCRFRIHSMAKLAGTIAMEENRNSEEANSLEVVSSWEVARTAEEEG